jgi:hypothetical protein
MTKCKLRVRRLTLALGCIEQEQAEEEVVDIDEEAARILAREHLHRAVEISITSSLSQKSGCNIHGVDDRLSGRFWATGNDSDSELESGEEDLPNPNPNVSIVDRNLVCDYLCVAQQADGEIKTTARTQAPRQRPWEGPLPSPRISPRLTIGDAIVKAKVRFQMDHSGHV